MPDTPSTNPPTVLRAIDAPPTSINGESQASTQAATGRDLAMRIARAIGAADTNYLRNRLKDPDVAMMSPAEWVEFRANTIRPLLPPTSVNAELLAACKAAYAMFRGCLESPGLYRLAANQSTIKSIETAIARAESSVPESQRTAPVQSQTEKPKRADVEALVSVLEDIRDNFDHDSDAHRYGTLCRCCAAAAALASVKDAGDARGEVQSC